MHALINREITASRLARDILDVCQKSLNEFDIVNVVTALHRLAKAPDYQSFSEHPVLQILLDET